MDEHAVRVEYRSGRTRRWNGAGDLLSDTIKVANRLSGGLIDKASGGKVSGPCKGCDKTKKRLNDAIPFGPKESPDADQQRSD